MRRPWNATDALLAALGRPPSDEVDRRTVPHRLRQPNTEAPEPDSPPPGTPALRSGAVVPIEPATLTPDEALLRAINR